MNFHYEETEQGFELWLTTDDGNRIWVATRATLTQLLTLVA